MNAWGDVEFITSLKWYLGYCWVSAGTPWVQLCVWLKIHAFTKVIEIRMVDLHISSTCNLYIANIVFNSNRANVEIPEERQKAESCQHHPYNHRLHGQDLSSWEEALLNVLYYHSMNELYWSSQVTIDVGKLILHCRRGLKVSLKFARVFSSSRP